MFDVSGLAANCKRREVQHKDTPAELSFLPEPDNENMTWRKAHARQFNQKLDVDGENLHVVKFGETLEDLARRSRKDYGKSTNPADIEAEKRMIISWNRDAYPDLAKNRHFIKPGWKLRMGPCPEAAKPVAGTKHGAGETTPVAGTKHGIGETMPVAGTKHGTGETTPVAGTKPGTRDTTPVAGTKHGTGETTPVSGTKHGTGETTPVVGTKHGTGETTPVVGTKHGAGDTNPLAKPILPPPESQPVLKNPAQPSPPDIVAIYSFAKNECEKKRSIWDEMLIDGAFGASGGAIAGATIGALFPPSELVLPEFGAGVGGALGLIGGLGIGVYNYYTKRDRCIGDLIKLQKSGK